MSRERLSDLRAEVRTLEARARRKVGRLRRQNNIDLTGSRNDPLRTADIGRYTQRQLENYRQSLTLFNSRGTQFYGDAYGKPITSTTWERYRKAERRYNREKDAFFSQFAKLKTPYGETLSDRMKRVTPNRPGLVAEVNSPYADVRRASRAFTSEKRVKELAIYMEGQVGEEAWSNRLRDARSQFKEMAKLTGNTGILREVGKLNDKQFAALWFYTNFTQSFAQHYETFKLLLGSKDSKWLTAIYHDSQREALREVPHAKKWRI